MNKTILIQPGQIVITPKANQTISGQDIANALHRHLCGDWGELDEHDKKQNDQALEDGGQILSAYRNCQGIRFWIITEWNWSVTTILLPEEY